MTKREQWAKLQARFHAAVDKLSDSRLTLKYRYGEVWSAPPGKRAKHEALLVRESAATEAIFAWLDKHSPRDWRTGCPYHWVCESLSFDDAVTTGQLSVVPPACWGGVPSDQIRFAAPLKGKEVA